ncbi:hypothetical protein ACQW02_18620 [Humitalea sp. 24SJ18S-53]|uniref:hypothetical protein n=1 Tax=Humitalea sp. 24SJ18S-53 TaxID=3422307 RepID=UPI003D66FFBC
MNNDHDDGLVHAHTWASEPPRPGRAPIRLTNPLSIPQLPVAQPDHDDGLVHSHGWACAERGQPGRTG